jgi:hypothetical protein
MFCQCRLRMQVRDEHAGRRVRCPRCGKVTRVPVPTVNRSFELQEPGEADLQMVSPRTIAREQAGEAPALSQSSILEPHWSEHDGGFYEEDEGDDHEEHNEHLTALQQASDPAPEPQDTTHQIAADVARGDTIDLKANNARRKLWKHLITLSTFMLAMGLFGSLTWFVILPAIHAQQVDTSERLTGVQGWVMQNLNDEIQAHQTNGPEYHVSFFEWRPERLDRPIPFHGVIVNATNREVGQVEGEYDFEAKRLIATCTYPAGPLKIDVNGP